MRQGMQFRISRQHRPIAERHSEEGDTYREAQLQRRKRVRRRILKTV